MSVPLLLKPAEAVSEPPLTVRASLPPIVKLCTAIVPLVMLIVWALDVLIVTAEVEVGMPALQSPAVFQLARGADPVIGRQQPAVLEQLEAAFSLAWMIAGRLAGLRRVARPPEAPALMSPRKRHASTAEE